MGMAASQARLLSITTRLSDNELRSQLINNSKMRLATESSQVSENYINALNEAQYMFTNYDADNKATYQQLTFNSLTAYNEYNNQYGVSNSAGQILVSEKDGKIFEQADGDLETFLKSYGLENRTTYFEELAKHEVNGKVQLGTETNIDGTTTTYYSKYSAAEIETIYNGDVEDGGDHVGYANAMQSTGFNEYLKLETKYLDAKEAYFAVIENVMKDYANGVKVNANGLGEKTYADIVSYVQGGSHDSNAVNYFYAFEQIIKQMETDGKFSTALNYVYTDEDGNDTRMNLADYMLELIDECKYTNDTTKNFKTNVTYDTIDGKQVAQFALDDDYIVRVTKGTTATDLTYELMEYDDETGDLVVAEAVDEDGATEYAWNGSTITLYEDNAEADKFAINFSWDPSKTEVSYTETLIGDYRNQVYFSNLQLLVNYFNDAYVNGFDASKFNDTAASNANYSDKYNAYVTASQNLANFIFGSTTAVTFDEYQYLDDYKWVADSGKNTTVDYSPVSDVLAIEEVLAIYGEPKYAYIKDGDYDQNGDAEAEWYTNLFNRMQDGYKVIENGLASSAEWMRYALESGLIVMEQVDDNNEWNSITFTSCSDITEQTNDLAVTVAEAEYQKAMNKIENKDKAYDMELKNIDTEHTALQTEYDSIKSALDKNVERNFKLYS